MCECLHRAGASKISLKNVASTSTFSLSNGDFRWQTTALDDLSQYFIGGMMPESANPRARATDDHRNRWRSVGHHRLSNTVPRTHPRQPYQPLGQCRAGVSKKLAGGAGAQT